MSSGDVRLPAPDTVDMVHDLIEQCLQLHLSKIDAENLILREANIAPAVTKFVWEQLERQNPEFFEVYYIRLALRQQVVAFNELLREQATLMQQINNGLAPSPGSNESHISGNGSHTPGNGSHMPVNGSCKPENGSHRPVNKFHGPEKESGRPVNGFYSPENGSHGPENESHMQRVEQNGYCNSADVGGPSTRVQNLQPTMSSSIPNVFSNGMWMEQTPKPFDLSTPSRGIDFLCNTLHIQSSNSTELTEGLRENIIESESGYSDSQITFLTNSNVVGTHTTMKGASFSGMEVSSEAVNRSPSSINGSSFGHFGQIPWDFSFSDLSTAYPKDNGGGISESHNSYKDARVNK